MTDPPSFTNPPILPSYSETDFTNEANQLPTTSAPIDDAPPYTPLDTHPTHFTINATFISSPAGPLYQLTSTLDQRGTNLRLRRLSPKEVAQAISPTAPPLPFDKSAVLYDLYQTPITHEVTIQGKRKSTVNGDVSVKSGVRHVHCIHKGKELLTSDREGGLSFKKKDVPLKWKGAGGEVLATQSVGSNELPVLELEKDLDVQMRELLIACWVARLWVAAGQGKSVAEFGLKGRVDAMERGAARSGGFGKMFN